METTGFTYHWGCDSWCTWYTGTCLHQQFVGAGSKLYRYHRSIYRSIYRNSSSIHIWAMKSALYVRVLHLQTAIPCDCPKTLRDKRPRRVALMDPPRGFTDKKGVVGRIFGVSFYYMILSDFIDLQNTQPHTVHRLEDDFAWKGMESCEGFDFFWQNLSVS